MTSKFPAATIHARSPLLLLSLRDRLGEGAWIMQAISSANHVGWAPPTILKPVGSAHPTFSGSDTLVRLGRRYSFTRSLRISKHVLPILTTPLSLPPFSAGQATQPSTAPTTSPSPIVVMASVEAF